LRTTVKAFVKTEEKKRSKHVEQAAAPPVEAPMPAAAPVSLPATESQPEITTDASVEQAVALPEQTGGAEASVCPLKRRTHEPD